ncbi:hypothetical protein CDEST_04583 [Colletotrichum destructivum]|uniref:Uncharacterized protein n=1 Tax=Colletotrichum destructivum TaxID=34406 RepID=A0AAX4I9C7_9PEZI|nr:hypothetical protein CDEST_04583 [Colletotrichum destructivum]
MAGFESLSKVFRLFLRPTVWSPGPCRRCSTEYWPSFPGAGHASRQRALLSPLSLVQFSTQVHDRFGC